MRKLPKGYFAVKNDLSDNKTFTYRGETFEVEEGVNLFATANDAVAAAKGTEAPSEVICSLPYENFEAPVVLFSAGVHNIIVFDRIKVYDSVIMLGEKAGVNPNLPAADRYTMPPLNPEREENETILAGSYWYGKLFVESADCKCLIMDGFTCSGFRVKDVRKKGGKFRFESKNIIHTGPCGWENNQYNFLEAEKDGGLERDILIKNVRMLDFCDLDYGGTFALINAKRAVLDNVCVCSTGQMFGFTTIPRSFSNCSQFDKTEITLKNSFLSELRGENGIGFSAFGIDEREMNVTVSGCTFINASRENEPVITPNISGDNTVYKITDCVIKDTRGNGSAAILAVGDGNISIENCEIDGFSSDFESFVPPSSNVPEFIDSTAGETNCEDSHEVLADVDFSDVEEFYKGRRAYYGDQHVHTRCGGTSDGSFDMKDWPAEMDRLGLDFAAVVDHRQMRGFFLPEWDEERFIMGTEPGARISGLNGAIEGFNNIHYNMLFPHKYGLAMVLANFPEFGFKGDELTGSFGYPGFTKERFMELTKYIQSIGGMMVHPHPKTMLASTDPMDYYYGEHMYLETLYCTFGDHVSFKNYDLWVALLAAGKHVYTSGGSDTHRAPSNAVVSTFYTKEKSGKAFYDQMFTGDYTVGCVGMKMLIDGNPMGSENEYKEGSVLKLEMGDYFKPRFEDNTAYELRIYTDKGLAYKSVFGGDKTQRIALKVKKRAFYRAEVFDLTHGYRVAVGNPIWLDREAIE